MSKKLQKSTYPVGHTANNFQCFGPPAIEDGNFDKCKICDMGSFSQEEKDSNKFYHVSVVQSTITKVWYTYFEWGRVGATNPQFQFLECSSEAEAQKEFANQCHEKNDKRGIWTTVAGHRTLTAKPNKDVYLVRQLATRSTGLPDAKTIKSNDGAKPPQKSIVSENKVSSVPIRKADPITAKLLQDITGGTINYTRGAMADASIPSQNAIDMARKFLTEAEKRLLIVGGDLEDQINDGDIRNLSAELYRRIPRKKAVGTPDEVWVLSQNNILSWRMDLDSFESALSAQAGIDEQAGKVADPFHGLPLDMEYIDPKTELGKFLHYWYPRASANKHYHLKEMKIKNMWKVDRHGDSKKFTLAQDNVLKEMKGVLPKERPLFQPSERPDVEMADKDKYFRSNTGLLFHGTRSINVRSILEKSFLLPKQLVGVNLTGAMFGSCGSYQADDVRKSALYTSLSNGALYTSGAGAISGRHAFMFLCDTVLGQPFIAPRSFPYTSPPNGYQSIGAIGRNAKRGFDSGVENNEWIIFNTNQTRIRYLAEFTF